MTLDLPALRRLAEACPLKVCEMPEVAHEMFSWIRARQTRASAVGTRTLNVDITRPILTSFLRGS